MHRIRPHLGLTLYALLGAAVGISSGLFWQRILEPHRAPQWVLLLVAAGTALLVLRVLAEVQHRHSRGRPRRAHARQSDPKEPVA